MRLARQAAQLARRGIVMVSLGLAACQSGSHMYVPQATLLVNGTIEIGMKRSKVLELLGPPQHDRRKASGSSALTTISGKRAVA